MAVSEDSDIKQENAHLKEIEDLIFDQDLILTYKRLSKMLNVHVNTAKRLLSLFVEKARKGKRPVSAAHLVSGREVSSGAWRVCVVAEDQLDATMHSLSSEGLSHHVYSVHQGAKTLDTGALVSASKIDIGTLRHAAIRNQHAVPREPDVMQQLAKRAALATAPTAAQVQKPTSSIKCEPGKKAEKHEEGKKETKEEGKKETKVEVKKEAGNTISGMFAAQNSKPADSNGKPAPKPAAVTAKGKKAKNNGNIASFFQRQKDAPSKIASSTESSPVTVKVEVESSQTSSEASSSQAEAVAVKESVPKENGKKAPSRKPSKASKKRKGKSEGDAPKKRKRIMAQSDSESSDDEVEVEMEDDTPPPPVSEVVVSDDEDMPTSTVIKERKLVDKVFKDEKGFIVTKKEWVVETRTESLEVMDVKKSPKKEVEESKVVPIKRKQSDIMSFFGRK